MYSNNTMKVVTAYVWKIRHCKKGCFKNKSDRVMVSAIVEDIKKVINDGMELHPLEGIDGSGGEG